MNKVSVWGTNQDSNIRMKIALKSIYNDIVYDFNDLKDGGFTFICPSNISTCALQFLKSYFSDHYENGWTEPLP